MGGKSVAKLDSYALPAAGERIELICLKGFDRVWGLMPPNGPTIVVRTGISKVRPVPAEMCTVEVKRSWVFGGTPYLKGEITEVRLDLERLAIEPLGLTEYGVWNPEEEDWLFEDDPSPLYDEIRTAGPRPQYEMEQVLPDGVVELRWEEDPILEASELAAAGAVGEAEDLLGELLRTDLRCLDAHAHLGNFQLRREWPGAVERAERHYRAGVAIGELSLPVPVLDFQGLLPWGLLDNRPFLRCLHGLGLALWRRGDAATAEKVFRRLVWLDPHDHLGARSLVEDVRDGLEWDEQDV